MLDFSIQTCPNRPFTWHSAFGQYVFFDPFVSSKVNTGESLPQRKKKSKDCKCATCIKFWCESFLSIQFLCVVFYWIWKAIQRRWRKRVIKNQWKLPMASNPGLSKIRSKEKQQNVQLRFQSWLTYQLDFYKKYYCIPYVAKRVVDIFLHFTDFLILQELTQWYFQIV